MSVGLAFQRLGKGYVVTQDFKGVTGGRQAALQCAVMRGRHQSEP